MTDDAIYQLINIYNTAAASPDADAASDRHRSLRTCNTISIYCPEYCARLCGANMGEGIALMYNIVDRPFVYMQRTISFNLSFPRAFLYIQTRLIVELRIMHIICILLVVYNRILFGKGTFHPKLTRPYDTRVRRSCVCIYRGIQVSFSLFFSS